MQRPITKIPKFNEAFYLKVEADAYINHLEAEIESMKSRYSNLDDINCDLNVTVSELRAENKKLREALIICEKEIDNYYLKMEQSSRIQTICSDDHTLWFARDNAYDALKEREK